MDVDRRLGGRWRLCSMDISQLCSILAACISDNPQQRKAAEATLAQVQLLVMHVSKCSYTRQRAKLLQGTNC